MSRLPADLLHRLVSCIEDLIVECEDHLAALEENPTVDSAHALADLLDEAIAAVESIADSLADADCPCLDDAAASEPEPSV